MSQKPSPRLDEIDRALKDSFPASDPPAYNLGREHSAEMREQQAQGTGNVGDTRLTGHDANLSGRRVAILATDGFEQSELLEPQSALEAAGATTDVISLKPGAIKAWKGKDWGSSIPVGKVVGEAHPNDYDALLLPGGVMNPDTLRRHASAVEFVKAFVSAGKPVAAICHGPWLLVEAGAANGRKLTSWPSLKTDIANAGGEWVDEQVVEDHNLITSRKPDDIPAFNQALLKQVAAAGEGKLKIGATNI